MNHRENRRPDAYDDRSRNQHNDHRPHDRFGDNYEPRHRPEDNWRDEARDDRGRFQSRWDQPHQDPQDTRRRHAEDDDRRRGFHSYGDYAGSEQGRGYGPGRPEAGRADYSRRPDDRYEPRHDERHPYHPEGTSGYLQDRRYAEARRRHEDDGRYERDNRQRGYDDARNLPAHGDFDWEPGRRSTDYRDQYTGRHPHRPDVDQNRRYRHEDDRANRRNYYDGSNRDGARSDYGYGDDYSSSLYDPNSRNSAFRRHPATEDRRSDDYRPSRRWSDTPDLGNQRHR